MTIDDSTEPPDESSFIRRKPPFGIMKPEHVMGVLKRFGQQEPSTLQYVTRELDRMVIDYQIALNKKQKPLKFEQAAPVLKSFKNTLVKAKKLWRKELDPLRQAIIAQRIEMIPQGERRQKANAAMASINLDLVATTLMHIADELLDPKKYAAAHYQPGGKSLDRAFLWEPLLRLMKKFEVKPGQHGSFLGAVKALHRAMPIDPPSEDAIKKMLHDFRQRER